MKKIIEIKLLIKENFIIYLIINENIFTII